MCQISGGWTICDVYLSVMGGARRRVKYTAYIIPVSDQWRGDYMYPMCDLPSWMARVGGWNILLLSLMCHASVGWTIYDVYIPVMGGARRRVKV